MPYDVKKFVFTVSLCAMLAANPVLATVPGDEESVGTAHNVYVESNLNKASNGIAGVGYVNRMVDAAGNAAQAAEGHAAAAGAHALSAAKSADEAHTVLADKVNIAQGTDYSGLAMVTDAKGSVYAGYVAPSMIKGENGYTGFLGSNGNSANWRMVGSGDITEGAVYSGHIATGAVTTDKIAERAVTADKISAGYVDASGNYIGGTPGQALVAATSGVSATVEWGQVGSAGIATGAVYSGHIANFAVYSGHIANGAVYGGHIANGAVTADKVAPGTGGISGVLLTEPAGVSWGKISHRHIADGAVTADKISAGYVDGNGNYIGGTPGQALVVATSDVSGTVEWGQVDSAGIANGAVTIEKTAGVVGMVPVGSAGANTYGQFWIE